MLGTELSVTGPATRGHQTAASPRTGRGCDSRESTAEAAVPCTPPVIILRKEGEEEEEEERGGRGNGLSRRVSPEAEAAHGMSTAPYLVTHSTPKMLKKKRKLFLSWPKHAQKRPRHAAPGRHCFPVKPSPPPAPSPTLSPDNPNRENERSPARHSARAAQGQPGDGSRQHCRRGTRRWAQAALVSGTGNRRAPRSENEEGGAGLRRPECAVRKSH